MNYDSMKKRYCQRESISSLSTSFKTSPYKIRKILKQMGVKLEKRKGFKTNPTLNVNYFSEIKTQNQAYILGLMYADGNVVPYKSKTGSVGSYKIRIRLQEQDQNILREISKEILQKDIVKIINRKESQWSNIASFQIGNIQLGKDLIKLGCPPNKSNLIRLPSEKQVPLFLMNHFIRGFFDGDGYCKKDKPIVTSFTSNKIFCEQLRLFLIKDQDLHFSIFKERKNGYGSIYLSHIKNCKKFYDFLYKDAFLYMSRKRNNFHKCFRTYD